MVSRLILNLKGAAGTTFGGTSHIQDTQRGPVIVDSYIDFPKDGESTSPHVLR